MSRNLSPRSFRPPHTTAAFRPTIDFSNLTKSAAVVVCKWAVCLGSSQLLDNTFESSQSVMMKCVFVFNSSDTKSDKLEPSGGQQL